MYSIIHDSESDTWWVEGDEGRVNEQPFDTLNDAMRYAFALGQDGKKIDLTRYYEHDPNHGPDWDNPITIK